MRQHARLSTLGDLLRRLAEGGAYVRHGRLHAPADPATWRGHLVPEIHRIAGRATTEWAAMDSWVQQQPSVTEIEVGLKRLAPDQSAAELARFASVDLAHRSSLMDPEDARDLASRAVGLLGPRALWWTNHEDAHSWSGVTGCTFDGMVAGTDGTFFAVLVQAVED
ncbi:hypothetical protein ACVHNB_34790 [Streptomyces sp. YJ-C3]